MKNNLSIVMLGASGAVGQEVVKTLSKFDDISTLTLLGRTPLPDLNQGFIEQKKINIFEPESYRSDVENHDIAICTLGVGEPSKMSREEFIKIDKDAVLAFAKLCKSSGIKHFQLLASISIDSKSRNYYLKTKGELVDELEKLGFEQLSIFQPSMILTPTNRYGWSQGLVLKVWPLLTPLLFGSLKKYRGVKVDVLGDAIAKNVRTTKQGTEFLTWVDFNSIIA